MQTHRTITSIDPTLNVSLHRNGQYVSITDEQVRILGGDITGRHLESLEDSFHGYEVSKSRKSLLRHPEGYRNPNAGCIPMLQYRASQRSIDLSICCSPSIYTLPEPVSVEYLSHPELTRFVRDNPLGIIRKSSRISVEKLVQEIAMAFPNQRIVVLGNHVRQLDKIRDALAQKVEGVQSISSRSQLQLNDDEEMPRIICSTFLEAAEADLATSDIVILLDAYQCGEDRAQLALSQMDARFRLYGVVDTRRKSAPSESDAVMGVFGPEVIDLIGYRRSRRAVNIAWLDSPGPRCNRSAEDKDFWYRVLWHNERRNRRIAQLAKSITNDLSLDRDRDGAVADWRSSREGRSRNVTILVDRPLHAVALSKKLPEWRVITGTVPFAGLPGSFRNRVKRQQREWITGERQIVLVEAARQFRGEVSDVVIWAGGGPSADFVPMSWLAQEHGTHKPLLIVDLKDQHNETTRQWSQARQRAYYDHEIFPLGITPAQGRMAMFMNRKPWERT